MLPQVCRLAGYVVVRGGRKLIPLYCASESGSLEKHLIFGYQDCSWLPFLILWYVHTLQFKIVRVCVCVWVFVMGRSVLIFWLFTCPAIYVMFLVCVCVFSYRWTMAPRWGEAGVRGGEQQHLTGVCPSVTSSQGPLVRPDWGWESGGEFGETLHEGEMKTHMMCCAINSWENLPLALYSGSRWWAHHRDISRAAVFTSEKLWRRRVRVSDSGARVRAHLVANRSSRPGRREGEVGDPQGRRRGWETRPQLPLLYDPPAGPEHQPQDSGAVLGAGSPFQALVQRFPPAHRLRRRAESGRVLRESLVLQQKTQEEQTQIFFGRGEERERESRRELPQGSQTHLGHLRSTHTGQYYYYYTHTHIWYKGQTHGVQHALTLLWTWAVKKDQQVISVLRWHPLSSYNLTFRSN